MDTAQVFKLIDSVLPFEACLYYQVLPLAIEGSNLKLGIVDPQDTSALDYVRRLLSYMNCSLAIQPISAEEQKSVLSAYLYHSSQSNKSNDQSAAESTPPVLKSPDVDRHSHPETDQSNPVSTTHKTKIPKSQGLSNYVNIPLPPPIKTDKAKPTTLKSQISDPVTNEFQSSLLKLELQIQHLSSPVEVLVNLPPSQLVQELLARVVTGGIGRLYLDRQETQGRILWSQDGKLQSSLENLPLDIFQSVINELKRMANLPVRPFGEAKQIEIERIYEENHLLLRLKFMPGKYGEEATLQVLRGVALKFHQQQQLSNLSMDALRLAEQLQRKIMEIKDRVRLAPMYLDALPALAKLLDNVNEYIDYLILNYANDKHE